MEVPDWKTLGGQSSILDLDQGLLRFEAPLRLIATVEFFGNNICVIHIVYHLCDSHARPGKTDNVW